MEKNDVFLHEHPLILSEEKSNKYLKCSACCHAVEGLCYHCNLCPYILHKRCFELRRQINHELHPDHPLVLLTKASKETFKCQKCIGLSPGGYLYTCAECPFNLCVSCASPQLWVASEAFQEKFDTINFQEKAYNPWDHPSCVICTEACFGPRFRSPIGFIHIHCGTLLKSVKHPRHLHNLTLHPPLERDLEYGESICDACEKERDPRRWIYYCVDCELVAHISCGIFCELDPPAMRVLEDHKVYKPLQQPDDVEIKKAQELADLDLEKKGGAEKEIVRIKEREKGSEENQGKLKYFNHPHRLQLYDEQFNVLICCNLCRGGICGKTYICEECGYYLHKRCAELPKEIRHPLHEEHPLILTPKHEYDCKYCRGWVFDSCYVCKLCRFILDPFEALVGADLKHESHDHPLTAIICTPWTMLELYNDSIVRQTKYTIRCSSIPPCKACGFPCMGLSFGCNMCDFHLHITCSLLPPSGKHVSHRHVLNLTFSYEEDPRALEFFCDACETDRIPNRWLYRCPDPNCYIVAHADCAVPKLFPTGRSDQ